MVAQNPPSENPQLDLFTPDRLPHRPYCTDDLGTSLRIRDAARALRHRYVQPNPPTLVYWLVYDVDREGAVWAFEDGQVAPPNLAVANPRNGHAHLLYGIEEPVTRTDAARMAPVRYAAAIEGGMRDALGADAGYSGLICKTPHHPDWRTLLLHDQLYDLGELADYRGVDLDHRPEQDRRRRLETGLGRNVWLFERLRHWAYRKVLPVKRDGAHYGQWHGLVLAQATTYNDFPVPLPASEVRATAKSVAKWVWRHFTPSQFSHIQAQRGAQKGRDRREALRPFADEMAAQGYSQRQIAKALKVDQATVSRWLQG